jgi:hypothetical protein
LSASEGGAKFKCPVCQARFRDSLTCSRCGADLTPLFLLINRAYRLRECARRALGRGELERARTAAAEALEACATPIGRELWLLTSCLQNGLFDVPPDASRSGAVVNPSIRLIPVRFTLRRAPANKGDRILLTGNTATLGKWAAPEPVSEGSAVSANFANWFVNASVPAGEAIQFKFVRIAADGMVSWEKGSYHTYGIPMSGEGSVVVSWQY